ncbi:hypothetical protein ACJ41O_008217 [Fusarium nematophilum]
MAANGNSGLKTNESQSQVDKPVSAQQPQITAPAPASRVAGDPREAPGLSGQYPEYRRDAPNQINQPSVSPEPSISSSNDHVRANSGGRRLDLFSGSQLGESFMESGITTPQNELAEPVKLGPELTRDLKRSIPSHYLPDRNRVPRSTQISDSFIPGHHGRGGVHDPAQRRNVSHMNDGFRDATTAGRGRTNGYYEDERSHPASPAKRDAQLPMREVRIRKSNTGRSEAYDVPGQSRSRSPTIRGKQWPTHHRREDSRQPPAQPPDNDDAESLPEDEEHMTPKPKKPKSVVKRVLLESSMPATTLSSTNYRDKKRQRASPEYDDVALGSMPFTALQQQPFDFDPSKEEQRGIVVNADNLDAKLDQFRHLSEKEQHDLFSNMSIDDWEASGSWFVSQFAGFMQSLTEARRNKRRIIHEFENEAASREEAVRLKTGAIDRKLCKMRQDGQRVVEDKGE